MLDKDFKINKSRDVQLTEYYNIQEIEPVCKDEYIKIPIDLPWNDLKKDVPLAYEKFGWYGMVHRSRKDWYRSVLYGGLGLTYNPDYVFDIPKHAQGLGQPRGDKISFNSASWVNEIDEINYTNTLINKLNTYDDPLGLRIPTDVTKFNSFSSIFEKLKRPLFQGRMAEIRAHEYGHLSNDENKELNWHTDEKNNIVSRILIPLEFSDDYFIEFKETKNRLYFEPGYAYHWNTHKPHRWNFNYHKNIKNRTCMVIGWSPWIDYNDGKWTVNEYCNKLHPMDMLLSNLVLSQ